MTDGIGQMWFGGVDITASPYYAGLTLDTMYWLMDGYTSTQFTTGIDSLGISRSFPKDWVLGLVLRSISPDGTRTTLMNSIEALNVLFDPTKGPQQLRIAEFPGSFWVAQNQSSKLANEAASPTMFEADIDFACTGPSYSTARTVVWDTIEPPTSTYTLTSEGDSQASPEWAFMPLEGFDGTFTIANTTSGESVSWTGVLDYGDYLTFIMDENTGTPYTLLQNGDDVISGASGSAWPHLLPGENTIVVQQTGSPVNGMFGVSWRDRFKMGLVTPQTPTAPSNPLPTLLSITESMGILSGVRNFSGRLTDVFTDVIASASVSLYSSTNTTPWVLVETVNTDSNGNYAFTPVTIDTGVEYFKVNFAGATIDDITYLPSQSDILETKGVISAVNSFSGSVSTGKQSITGVGFQPKAVIIWGTATSTYAWSQSTDLQICYGFGTGSKNAAYLSIAADGAVTTTACQRRFNNNAICGLVQHDGSLLCEASLVSMDPDGFTLNWNKVYPQAFAFHYLALGGDSITNAKVVDWTNITTTGNQSITSVGFEPSVVMHLGAAMGYMGTALNGLYMMGAMDGSGNQWSKWGYDLNGAGTSSNTRCQLTDSCIVAFAQDATSPPSYKAAYSTMLADGFEIEWSANSGTSFAFASLCIAGGNHSVGSWGTEGAGFESVAAPGIAPTAIFMTNDCHVTSASCLTSSRLMIGASDGVNNAVAGVTDKEGVDVTVTYKVQYPDFSMLFADNDAAAFQSIGRIAARGTCTAGPQLDIQAEWTSGQGVAHDGTNYYVVATEQIFKYDSSWTLIASNTNAGDSSNANVGHLGGCDYYNGKLYVAACDAGAGTPPPISNARIAVFNASDLSFSNYGDISAQFTMNTDPSGCGIDIDTNVIWVSSFWNSGTIYKYNLADFTYAGSLTPPKMPHLVQDIKYYQGLIYVSYCNAYNGMYGATSTDLSGGVKAFTEDGAYVDDAVFNTHQYQVSQEIEGLFVGPTGVDLLLVYGAAITGYPYGYSRVYKFSFGGGFTPWWDIMGSPTGTETCYVVFGGSTSGTPPEAAPIVYAIGITPPSVDANLLQYFSACGYTSVYLVAEEDAAANVNGASGWSMKTYQTEYDMITALGMTPVLDIEFVTATVGGPEWRDCTNTTQTSAFDTWFAALAAVGWTTVASEHRNPSFIGGPQAARAYFSGYVNYSYGAWSTNQYTTQNTYEAFFDSDATLVYTDTRNAANVGKPNGLLAYVGAYDIYTNSVHNGTPSYRSLLDWSVNNLVQFNTFLAWIDPNAVGIYNTGAATEYFLLYYLDSDFDSIVSALQASYPPAGTGALVAPTLKAPKATLNVTGTGSTYSFSGTLTELLTSDVIASANVHLQVTYNIGWDWIDLPGVTNPATTDSSGNFAWNSVTLPPGPYNFRVYYPGVGSYFNTYAPNNRVGTAVSSYGSGTTATAMSITSSPSTPTLNQSFTLTATLTHGGTPLAGANVFIYFYLGGNWYNLTSSADAATPLVTDSNGHVSLTTSMGDSGYQYTYYAEFYGDNTYAHSTASIVHSV